MFLDLSRIWSGRIKRVVNLGQMCFELVGINKCQKFHLTIFFEFLRYHYGVTNDLEILNFNFSNTIPRGVSTCKILTFQEQYFQKYKLQKIVKFNVLDFSVESSKILPSKTYGTLKMFLLSAQNNFYIILSSYVEGHVQKYSSLNFMYSVGFQVSKIQMLFQKFFCGTSLEIIFRPK